MITASILRNFRRGIHVRDLYLCSNVSPLWINRCSFCLATTTGLSNRNNAENFKSVVYIPYNQVNNGSKRYLFWKKKTDVDKHDKKQEKKSLFKRFKEMYRDYWYVLIPVHLVTSAGWVAGFYYLARSGVDVPALLEAMNFSEKIVNSMRQSSMGYFAITYGLYKIATPARYAVTLGGTTLSIQYLKKWGYIKPTKELKEMYQEKKHSIKEAKENILGKVSDLREKKDNFIDSVRGTSQEIKVKKDSLLGSMKDAKQAISKVVSSKDQKP